MCSFPPFSSRCFTSLAFHLHLHSHLLPTYLKYWNWSDLVDLIIQIYAVIFFCLNNWISNTKIEYSKICAIYFVPFKVFFFVRKLSIAYNVIYKGGYQLWWNKEILVGCFKKSEHLLCQKAAEWYSDWGNFPLASSDGEKTISPFASLLFVVKMWNLFHTNTFSFSHGVQTHKSSEVPILSIAPSPNFQSGLRIRDEFLMEKMSCLLASSHLLLIYFSDSAF